MTQLATRGDMLADLAAAVNELTEVRHHVEVVEVEKREGTTRKRVRAKRVQEFPSLLDALLDAMQPATSGDASAAGFESRPAAELEPIAVVATITQEAGTWARALKARPRKTLAGQLHALISTNPTDTQMRNLVRDAEGWVRKARIATGWEIRAFTLNQPCPYCWTKNSLTVTGDLEKARCSKCTAEWDEMTIGLLGSMLTVNAEAETWVTARCESIHHEHTCQRLDGHYYEHRDSDGRYWYSTPSGMTYVETRTSA